MQNRENNNIPAEQASHTAQEKDFHAESNSPVLSLSSEEANKRLKKAGLLMDPARVCALYFSALSLIVIVIAGLLFGTFIITNLNQSAGVILRTILLGLQVIAMPVALWLMFRPAFATPVFYLRSFRSDDSAKKIRLLIRSAIGAGYRLSGIRPPSRRISWFSRLLFNTSTGFRYLQSNDFEMEAPDHNWMARLLASYQKAPFVFIDVRDITVHVEDEIRLSYLAMGPERSIFIIDESQQNNLKWRDKIATILRISHESSANLKLAAYPGDESPQADRFVATIIAEIDSIPKSPANVTQAVSFACTKVSERDWRTPFYEKDGFQFVVGLILAFALQILVIELLGEKIFGWFILAQAIAVAFFLASALYRSWAVALSLKRLSKSTSIPNRSSIWRPLFALLFAVYFVAMPLVYSFIVVPMEHVDRKEIAINSLHRIKNLHYLCLDYASDSDSYPTSLAEAAYDDSLLISPFAPDSPIGYKINPDVTPESPGDTILIEDLHAPLHGYRIILFNDGSARITHSNSSEENSTE